MSRWFVVASGPSLIARDVRKVRGRGTVCVVNSSWKMAPWANVLYASDWHWWRQHRVALRSFAGRKVSNRQRSLSFGAEEVVPASFCKEAEGLGISRINWGGNSGYQAINLAYLEGATEIALLGFDMQYTYGQKHWHEDHVRCAGNADNVEEWVPRFDALAADLDRLGVRVVNCTRHTALKCFEQMTIDQYLEPEQC